MTSETTEIVSSPAQIALFILLGGFIFAAVACQFFAMRHRSKDWLQFVHKDSMFKNKDLAYTETGMKFIRAQKYLAIAAMATGLILAMISGDNI
ncbi:hypothetical protein [Curvivirga sp.]|uniref:hypothetical protein n=1 Tax=Curvivirga sp. TaxID=2856848 RepID=UPI003B5BD16D